MTEQSTANLFSSLHITGKDEDERTLIIWKLEDIVNQRQLFLTMLEQAVVGRNKVSLKYLHKTKISRDDFWANKKSDQIGEGIFNTRYFKTWKTYHFHFLHSDKDTLSQSFTYFPFQCLLQGVFLDPDAAVAYARFFYKEGDNILDTNAYKLYLVEQTFSLKALWESQNISQLLWNLLFIVLLEEEEKESKLMLNEIYRMLSVIPACLKTISKMMNISLKLIEAYIASDIEDFKNGSINELRIVLDFLEQAKTNCNDRINIDNFPEGEYMRDTIGSYMQQINKLVSYAYPDAEDIVRVVKTGGNLFDVVAESNYQIV